MIDINLDDDAIFATADLVGRTGARNLQVGYLHENVPAHEADWYAHAQYAGARIIAEHHAGPVEALDALARRILTGAQCKCGRLVALADDGAIAYDNVTLADGTTWTVEQAKAAGQCRWRRTGPRWRSGCENRAERRAPPLPATRHTEE